MQKLTLFSLAAAVSMAAILHAQTPGPFVHVNSAIDKLKRGKSLAGAIVYDFSMYAARRFAQSDLDFIILDMEHQALDFETMQNFFMGLVDKAAIARQGNIQQRVVPIVRIPTYGRDQNEFISKQVLDMGAMGIMFPAIETKDQAMHAVQLARYPQPRDSKVQEPRGLRGNGQLPGLWFWGVNAAEYARRAEPWPIHPQGELLLFLQVETAEGVKNINEILSVPGIGVLFVGPNDLSVLTGRATGPSRPRSSRADRPQGMRGPQHSLRHHGDTRKRCRPPEAGFPGGIAAERWLGVSDGRRFAKGADCDGTERALREQRAESRERRKEQGRLSLCPLSLSALCSDLRQWATVLTCSPNKSRPKSPLKSRHTEWT